MSESPKKTFGKYEAISHLGSGAMGVVWRAQDPVLGRTVAVKTISAALGADKENKERFLREARAAAQLNHPNIITVFDFGQADNELYMAMELLEGKDLKELISGGQLTFDEKLDIMEQVTDGLAYAHGRDVIHRDLKPGNMHVQPNGQVKILDFGLARLGSSDLTKTGVIMGTPNYMSPEQVLGERVDARSDVFSVGGVFYELLTNRKPFDADSVPATLYQVVHRDPPPPRQWEPGLPDAVILIVETAMHKQVGSRYQNAAAFRDAIRAFRYGEVPEVVGPPVPDDSPLATLTESETTAISQSPPTLTGSGRSKAGSFRSYRGPRGSATAPPSFGDSSRVSNQSGSQARSGSTPESRRDHHPRDAPSLVPPAPERPTSPLLILGVVAIVVVAAGAAFVGYRLINRPADDTESSALLKARTANLVETQIDLAGRLLADKDYDRALQQTAATLEIEPGNLEALGIRDQAQSAIRQIESSVAAAQQAVARGDSEQASAAVQRVLALDPTNPVVAQLSGQLNANFAARASGARSQMETAKTQARAKTGADRESAFREGERMAATAAQALQARQFTTATQAYLQASDAYDRARRAVESKEREAERMARARTQTATPRPTAAPPPVVALATPASTTLVLPPSLPAGPTPTPNVIVMRRAPAPTPAPPLATPVATALPRATAVPTPPPAPTVAPPIPETRAFTASRMTITAAPGAKQTPFGPLIEFAGKCEFEVTPSPLTPGSPFLVQLFVRNDSQNNAKIEQLTVKVSRNGQSSSPTARISTKDVKIAQRALLTEIPGTWVAGTTNWVMDVTARSKKGEQFSCSLTMNK